LGKYQATFTGGVQISVLSFVNDLFSKDAINLELYRPYTGDLACGKRYTFFSLGLMIGVIAACLHIGVAAIAAANAALTCRLANLAPEDRKGKAYDMGARAMYCMALLFVAFNLSGASLVSLCVGYDVAFTITVGLVYFSGLIVAVFQLIDEFTESVDWFFGWHETLDPVRLLSCLGIGPLLALAILSPSPSSWPPFLLSCLTLIHHMFACLTSQLIKAPDDKGKSVHTFPVGTKWHKIRTTALVRIRTKGNEQRLAGCAIALALAWAACIAGAATWGLHDHLDEKKLQLGVTGLAALQTLTVGFIGIWGVLKAKRIPKETQVRDT
jgi:hypothetical protein